MHRYLRSFVRSIEQLIGCGGVGWGGGERRGGWGDVMYVVLIYWIDRWFMRRWEGGGFGASELLVMGNERRRMGRFAGGGWFEKKKKGGGRWWVLVVFGGRVGGWWERLVLGLGLELREEMGCCFACCVVIS